MFFFCFKEVRSIAEIDALEIKISASAEQANKAIRNLTRSLGALSSALKFDTSSLEKLGKINGNNFKKISEGLQSFANAARSLQGVDGNNFDKLSQGLSKIASIDPSKLEALGKIDGNSFRGLGEGVKALSAGLKDLKGVSTKKFETLASGIERLGAIQVGNMQTVASALTPLADGIRTLSSANFDNRNLQNLINNLTRLSNANVGGLASVDFTTLGNNIKGLATALSGADKVEQNTISMTNAIAKLAGAGANIGTVTTELPRLGTALKDFMNTMSSAPILASETIAFTQAIGQLANAGSKAETVANSLQHLGDELKRFMQTMASAPNVSSNVIQMTQALAQLANAGGGTGRAASSLGNAFNGTSISAIRLSSNTNILSVSLKGLGSRLNKTLKGVKSFTSQILAAAGIMGGLYGVIRGGLKAMEISSSLTEVQNVVDTTFGDMSDKVQEFADNSIRQFGMSELSVKQFASRFQAMGTAMGISPNLIKSSNEFLNKQTEGYVGLSDSMSDVSLNLTKLTADIASFYDVEQKEVAEDLAAIYTGMTVPLRKYGLDLTQATLKEWAMKNGLDANIKSMSQAEKTMLRYQYVLANTTAAQGDFAKTADTWANQVRILKQSFEQLGSIIGTSLINAFKPLVQTLNSVLLYVIDFAEKVTEALGTIFGWKYEAGGTGGIVQDWSDIADTTGEVAGNIDKMKKGLRAFDELNNITSPDKSGGGAGAGGGLGEGAGGGLVKTDAIWEKYKSDIDTLGKLGKYIGDTLSKAMEDIDWDSVYEKARNFGNGLADFLNGLISPRLFSNIGTTIAGSLNTALHFLDSFGLWFNWKNFGDSLAAGLLGFLNNIQWETALSAASNWGKGIADTLNHFISPETFGATGNAIAMALNTAIQFALSFGQTFDFKNLGESIAAGINDFFATFNFKDLAATINIWAKGILDTVVTILDETDWYMIGEKIGTFLENLDFIEIGGKVANALWKAIFAALETWTGSFRKAPLETVLITAFATLKWTKLGSFVSQKIGQSIASRLGIEVASNAGIGIALVTALKTGFSTALAGAGGLSGLFTLDVTALVSGGGFATAGLTIGTAIIGGIVAAIGGWNFGQFLYEKFTGEEIDMSWAEQFDEIKNSFSDGSWKSAIGLWAQDIYSGLVQLGEDEERWAKETGETINKFMEDTFGEWAGATLPEFGDNLKSWWDTDIVGAFSLWGQDISTFWDENVAPWFTMEKWSELGQGILDGISTKWNEFKEWWGNTAIVSWWDENVSPWFTVEKWNELGENIKTGISEKWNEFSEWWQTTGLYNWWNDNVSPWFEKDKWSFSGIKEGLSEAWNAAIDSIKQIWNGFASWLNEKLTWTINPISIGGKTVFEGATIDLGKIPMFAKGGVFRGGNPFMAIVNDQPSGQTNVEAPLKVIKQALHEELASFTDKFNNVQLAPTFEVGQFQPAPPPEFDFESRRQGVYEIAAEVQRENSRAYSNSDGYDNYSEEASLLMSQNQLLKRQNELLEQLVKKEFGISKSDIGKAARDYSIEYFNRTGNPAYQF